MDSQDTKHGVTELVMRRRSMMRLPNWLLPRRSHVCWPEPPADDFEADMAELRSLANAVLAETMTADFDATVLHALNVRQQVDIEIWAAVYGPEAQTEPEA